MLTPGFPNGRIRCGLDLQDIPAMEAFLMAHPTKLGRVFTPGEQAQCEGRRDRASAYAARFAAKEAAMKAIGVGWPEIAWTDCEVTLDSEGRPKLRLHGAAQKAAGKLHLLPKDLSLTHSAVIAGAIVIMVQE